jgi:hypothetical protein
MGHGGEGDGKWQLNGNQLVADLHYGGDIVSFNGNQLMLQGLVEDKLLMACSKR